MMTLLDHALKTTDKLAVYTYIAPLLKQSKAIMWGRIKDRIEKLRRINLVDINEGELYIRFKHNGAIIRLFGADNPDAVRGLKLNGCILDETANMKPEIFYDIVQPALSDSLGFCQFIGTPMGLNMFSELFYKGLSGAEGWASRRYTVFDTESSINPSEIKRLQKDMPEQSWLREYMCDFSASGDDQLVSLGDAEESAKRVYLEADTKHAPLVFGLDIARFGDDRSVLFKRQGLQSFTPYVYKGLDNMTLATKVANLIEEHNPDAVFCDAGQGSGVIDRLRQLSYDVMEIPFGGKAIHPEKYINRRTEMWYLMKEWIEEGGAIPNDVALKQELATPTYWFDNQGRKVLESKDQIKKRLQGAGSPDLADALALTFAAPVAKKLPEDIYIKRRDKATQKKEYDPYKVL